MNGYEIGKDIAHLEIRVKQLEQQFEDLASQDRAKIITPADSDVELEVAVAKGWKRYTFPEQSCRAMRHQGSWLKIWPNGRYESSCTLRDASRHAKWGNAVDFYLYNNAADDDDIILVLLGSWSGNFSPGETKTYTTSGRSAGLAKHFDDIGRDGLYLYRGWSCWRR